MLLRVDVAGLCHSDLHIIDGMPARAAAGGFKPFCLSHEIGGTVLAVGSGVDGALVGKERVLYPWLGCGKCMQCTDPDGHEIFCMGREMKPPLASHTFGTGNNGGFASHLLVPDVKYLVDPGDCPMPLAATYTCSGLTAFAAVRKCELAMQGSGTSPLNSGRSLLIIGAGGLGLHGIGWAKILTDCNVVVAEPDPTKHAAATEAGADVVLDTGGEKEEALDLIREATVSHHDIAGIWVAFFSRCQRYRC